MKGILFKPNMIPLIVNGSKSQTRRVIKLKGYSRDIWDKCIPHNREQAILLGEPYLKVPYDPTTDNAGSRITARYKVGETVYIKEAWATENQYNHLKPSEIPRTAKIFYLSDGYDPFTMGIRRSPLFMPAWVARYFITIIDARVERLQSINFEDCLAEGIVHTKEWQEVDYKAPEPLHPVLSHEEADEEISRGWVAYTQQAYAKLWVAYTQQVYAKLWDSINKEYPWDSNCWVWKYVFAFKKEAKQ